MNHDCAAVEVPAVDSDMNHGTCSEPRSSEQLSQQAGGRGARSGLVFTEQRESGREKFPQNVFEKGHFQIMKPNQTYVQNSLCYWTWVHRSSESVLLLNERYAGETLQPFPPIHASKGLDFLLNDILAPTYDVLQIDQK